jgi:hypothetical protein
MPATRVQETAKPASAGGFSYAQVEAALARVFGADTEGQAGWLRGRIQHLRRLGLTPPAEGGPISYTFEWAARWLLALRLERVGVSPVAVVKFFEANWERKPGSKFPVASLREVIEQAREPIKKARQAKRPYHADDAFLTVRFDGMPGELPKIGQVWPYKKPHPRFDNAKGFFDYLREHGVDEVVIPLTELLRELEAALSNEQ